MPTTITAFETHDIRFPTSQQLDGSDAMNPDPDYSAAYVVLRTDSDSLNGFGMTFTIGRGNELCVAGIQCLAHKSHTALITAAAARWMTPFSGPTQRN